MSYARVEDVPTSREQYDAMARNVGQVPVDLLLPVAGPKARAVIRDLRAVRVVIGQGRPGPVLAA